MKDLTLVSKQEQEDFLNPIEYVFCDVDGVLWHFQKPIPGALEALNALKRRHKQIKYVSNNSTKTQSDYVGQLRSAGYELDESDLIRPSLAMIDFLTRRQFTQKIFLIGMKALRSELQEAGFTVENFQYHNPEASLSKYLDSTLSVEDGVGAVIADIDVNVLGVHLQRAASYLKKEGMLFITGGADRRLCLTAGETIIGPGYFQEILSDASGRKAHCLAKPSLEFNAFIRSKIDVRDASKVLFIGDSVPEDMGFATNCGYKKLLVLSGLTSKEAIREWTYPEEYKPQYYVNSLQGVYKILSNI